TERLGVILRIVEGDLQIHVSKVTPAIALGDAHGLAARMAEAIQPGALFETGCLDDERLAFPASHRRSHPAWFRIFWQRASVDINLPRGIAVARYDHDLARRLNHIELQHQQRGREAAWLAVRGREILTALLPLLHDGGSLRFHRPLGWGDIPHHVEHVFGDV